MSPHEPLPPPVVVAPAAAALASPPPPPPAAASQTSNWVEKATLAIAALALVGTAINGCYVFVANKEYVEAEKMRAELALYRMKRAVVTSSAILSNGSVWGDRLDLCTITGSYQLSNEGGAPIRIGLLRTRVFEVDSSVGPPDGKKVSSISFGHLLDRPPLFIEEIPDSAGLVMPGEQYSRSYGYIIRRDARKQYAVEIAPVPSDPGDYDPNAFRAWSNLTSICSEPMRVAPL